MKLIVNYTIHQNLTNTKTLKPHLKNLKQTFGAKIFNKIEEITADAGYVSEEKYDYLESEEIRAYVKYNSFDKEQDKNYQKSTNLSVKKIYITTQKNNIMYVRWDKKCIKHIKQTNNRS